MRWLTLVPLAFLGLFFAYPLGVILQLGLAPNGALDLAPFALLAQDPYFWQVLWFSTWSAGLSTLLTLATALPAAWLFARYRFRGKLALRALAALPFVMPTIVVAGAFNALLGPRGVLNGLAEALFGPDGPAIDLQHTLALMLIAHVFYNFSLVLRIVGGFWGNLDRALGDAAAVLGANRARVFREISLPLLLPALGSAALLIYIFCFGAFGTVLMLAGPRYSTVEVEIYIQATSFLNLPVAAALSAVQMAVTLVLSAAYTRVQARTSVPLQLRSTGGQLLPLRGTRARLLYGAVIAIILILLVSPLAALAARAAALNADGRAFAALFQLERSARFGVPAIQAVPNSLAVALGTVLIALVCGMPAAYLIASPDAPARSAWMARARRAISRWLFEPLFMLPLGTSAVTLGLGYIVAFSREPFNWRASPWLMPAAHALVALPYVVRALLPTLRAIDPRLREAAAVLGAPPLRVWREVDLPILARGVLVAATLAFSASIGEFGASLLIARPDFPTMPVVIYAFLGQPGAANYAIALAMSTLLMLVTAAGFMLIERARTGNSEF